MHNLRSRPALLLLGAVALLLGSLGGLFLLTGGAAGDVPTAWVGEDEFFVEEEREAASFALDPGLEEDSEEPQRRIAQMLGLEEEEEEILLEEESARFVLRGRVVNDRGQPQHNALVSLYVRPRPVAFRGGAGGRGGVTIRERFVRAGAQDRGPRKGAEVRTGRDGRFEFQGEAPRRTEVGVVAQHSGFAPAADVQPLTEEDREVDLGDLVLASGGVVTGTVADAGGIPLPRAEVLLAMEGRRGPGLDRASLLETVLEGIHTNNAGGFQFRDVPEGRLRVRAQAPGMLPGQSRPQNLERAGSVDVGVLRLQKGHTLRGMVLTPEGRPAPEAVVTAMGGFGGGSWMAQGPPRAATGADGRFTLEGVPGSALTVRAIKEGFREARQNRVEAAAGEELMLWLRPAMAIEGVVVDAATGAPVEHFAVRARRVWDAESVRAQMLERIASVEDVLNASGVDARRVEAMLSGEGGERRGRGLGAALRGPGGRGEVDPAEILMQVDRMAAARRARPPGPVGRPEDRPQGRYLLDGLDPGLYVVDVAAPGFASSSSAEVRLVEGQNGPAQVHLALRRALIIEGICVQGREGEAVADADVRLYWHDPDQQVGSLPAGGRGPGPLRGFAVGGLGGGVLSAQQVATAGPALGRTRTDEEGRFRFESHGPGSYLVVVEHHELAPFRSEPIRLTEGRDATNLVFRVPRGGVLEGRVTGFPPDAEGRNAMVSVLGTEGTRREVRAAADGTYRVDRLPAGEYFVRARLGASSGRGGGRGAWVAREVFRALSADAPPAPDLVLREEQTVRFDVELLEASLGVVHGHLTHNGSPAEDMRVSLRSADAQRGEPGGASMAIAAFSGAMFSATVEQDGSYRIENVPEGRYLLEVRAAGRQGGGRRGGPGGFGGQRLLAQEVSVSRGSALYVPLALRTVEVRGTVQPAEGETLRGVRVQLVPASQTAADTPPAQRLQGAFQAEVADEGRSFHFQDVPVGDYTLVVQARGHTRHTESLTVGARGASAQVSLTAAPPEEDGSDTPRGAPRRPGR